MTTADKIAELDAQAGPWECFQDAAYYDMWCVRQVHNRTFGHGFHLVNGDEAAVLRDMLNSALRLAEQPLGDVVSPPASQSDEAPVENVNGACTDWDGKLMADPEEPRNIPNCGELRALATRIESLSAQLTEAKADAEEAKQNAITLAIKSEKQMHQIAQLKADAEMLAEELKVFSDEAWTYEPDEGDGDEALYDSNLTIGDLRRAAKALASYREKHNG